MESDFVSAGTPATLSEPQNRGVKAERLYFSLGFTVSSDLYQYLALQKEM